MATSSPTSSSQTPPPPPPSAGMSQAAAATAAFPSAPPSAVQACPLATPCPGDDGIDAAAGRTVAAKASKVASDYKSRGVAYVYGADAAGGGTGSDCSHYVHDVMQQSGVDVPYVTTSQIDDDPSYSQVSAEDAQAGDVMVQGDHMGVFTGTTNNRGLPQGEQMGVHGAADGSWGIGGWFAQGNDLRFYRPNP